MSAVAPRDGTTNEQSPVVLLLVDVINDFAFPEAPRLLRHALPAARKIAALKKRLRAKGIPAVYVNDNFGRWRSDFRTQVERCIGEEARGAPVARLLIPAEDDYFVLKPKHSGFYASSLDVLLKNLGAKKLIITGFAADICVLFTANDAYMRDFEVIVPADCTAAETTEAKHRACAEMKRFLRAEIRPSSKLRL
ncbi:MAG TPA: isochorismatase family cysteine hydrolase [Chthoniobacteraceae bacterium]|nr:isochorismatase family cysteine hydrolase [Chthoniobacteraceae bacterium]